MAPRSMTCLLDLHHPHSTLISFQLTYTLLAFLQGKDYLFLGEITTIKNVFCLGLCAALPEMAELLLAWDLVFDQRIIE